MTKFKGNGAPMSAFGQNLWQLYLDAAPWLVLGLVVAGLIKAWLPEDRLVRWLGGEGLWPVIKAALIGAPLPLCSCGVLPAAIGLRRAGASKSATLSFLVATPETGPDSIALSYALLGPFMAIIRPIAAILSAIYIGALALWDKQRALGLKINTGCCEGHCELPPAQLKPWTKTLQGLSYAFSTILDDLWFWLLIGLLAAALIATWVPPLIMAEWGSGLGAKFLMLIAGIPMYICATASTPLAASLLLAGISPGTVLVFLLAGPATNIATVAVIRQEMGLRIAALYLFGIASSSIGIGWAVDQWLQWQGLDLMAQLQAESETIPAWLAWSSALILLLAAIKPLRRYLANLIQSAHIRF